MMIGQTMTETISRAETAIHVTESLAAADPLRPVVHFRPAVGTVKGSTP